MNVTPGNFVRNFITGVVSQVRIVSGIRKGADGRNMQTIRLWRGDHNDHEFLDLPFATALDLEISKFYEVFTEEQILQALVEMCEREAEALKYFDELDRKKTAYDFLYSKKVAS